MVSKLHISFIQNRKKKVSRHKSGETKLGESGILTAALGWFTGYFKPPRAVL
jgi:hypothetical protein